VRPPREDVDVTSIERPPDERSRTIQQRRGDAAERLAATYLEGLGWTVLGRNVHVGRAELDIVALDPGPSRRLVAVEVRWRSGRAFGLPEETFDRRKRGRVVGALLGLVEGGRLPDGTRLPRATVAVDLIVLEPAGVGDAGGPRLRHHRDAA
jgi:putative endonuclease